MSNDNESQEILFDVPPHWEDQWNGMPEYKMGNTEPAQKITISFKSFDDVKEFGRLIGQRVTPQTDSLWFPKQDWIPPKTMRYVDES